MTTCDQIREVLDTLYQWISLPEECSRTVGQYLLHQCISQGCITLNQLQYLLQVGEQAKTMLEKFLLRLNEQGLDFSARGWSIKKNRWLRFFGPACNKLGRRTNAGEGVMNWMQQFRKTVIVPNVAYHDRHARS